MVFSSLVFLFAFLPIMLIGYYILKDNFRNYFLLLGSLFFYAWGEPSYVIIMLLSIVFNYLFGILVSIDNPKSINLKNIGITLSVIFNIGFLVVFKYTGFIIDNLNSFLGTSLKSPEISLPLGISFFTFQALSYVIDVYRGNAKVQLSIFNLALYISLFPQLVAGPIVRYQTLANQILYRKHSLEKFNNGVNRFIIGLSKKILIANPLGSVADGVFNMPTTDLSVATSWIGIIAYSLQIFFDFSGYSDMAIGLGKMFGFDFLENFNYPYISKNVSEFWRRWHISLGSWFKDYVYIPLGGNRVCKIRVFFNLFIVWMLTGFWHGADWSFIVWGLYFGVLIFLEKSFLLKILSRIPTVFSHIYLLIAVIISWVFFRSDSFVYAIDYIKVMTGLGSNKLLDNLTYVYINDFYFVFLMGILFSMPIVKYINNILTMKNPKIIENNFIYFIKGTIYSVLFLIIILKLVNSSYNPFLYFRF
ncbi:MAG: MBOAT family O-acyltransferase [Clostridium sp.]